MAGRKPRSSDEDRAAKVAALKAQLDSAVGSLEDEEHWVEYLHTVSQFGTKYSWSNQLLIMAQMAVRNAEPQLVMGFNAWKQRKRSVVKGETGLKIWAPNFRYPTADEIAKAEAEGKRVRRDADGRPAKILAGYRIEHVFDVSQTDGEPVEIPSPVIETIRVRQSSPSPELLTGEDVAGAWDAVATQIQAHGYKVTRGSCGGANGYTDPSSHEVRVRDDVSPAQALKTLIHELAHIVCDHVDDLSEYLMHRGRMETEAESVAYIVCGALGLDSGKYSAPYVRSWSGGNAETLAAAAEIVCKSAQQILKALEATEAVPVAA